jgi:hypothetical protein
MREAASTFLVDLHQGDLPIVCWLAFGLPRTAVYFPICLAGELPAGFGNGAPGTTSIEDRAADIAKLATRKESRDQVITAVDRLQARIDQDAEEFLGRALDYQHHGKPHLVPAIATEMMHHHVEFFDKEYRQLFGISDRIAPPPQEPEEVLFFA